MAIKNKEKKGGNKKKKEKVIIRELKSRAVVSEKTEESKEVPVEEGDKVLPPRAFEQLAFASLPEIKEFKPSKSLANVRLEEATEAPRPGALRPTTQQGQQAGGEEAQQAIRNYTERPSAYTSIRVIESPEMPRQRAPRAPDMEFVGERVVRRERLEEPRMMAPTNDFGRVGNRMEVAVNPMRDPLSEVPNPMQEYVNEYIPKYIESSASSDMDDIMKGEFFSKRRKRDL